MKPELLNRSRGGGSVTETAPGRWRMEIPAGRQGAYRWAQLDDYMGFSRRRFLWKPPLNLELRARVSADLLPGTWGFGLWNDPFTTSLGLSGMSAARLPALPNAAWFFYAGPPNYLAFRDDHPAQGFLAATFSAPRVPSLMLAPAGLALPLLAVRPLARLARRAVRGLVRESAALVPGDATTWRSYQIAWSSGQVVFSVDGQTIYSTPVSPHGPLGLVLWLDNQFAAFPPTGRVAMGTSANPQGAWIELADIEVTAPG